MFRLQEQIRQEVMVATTDVKNVDPQNTNRYKKRVFYKNIRNVKRDIDLGLIDYEAN